MIDLSIEGKAIVLNPDTEISIELKNPMLGDGIEDSFSLPMTIPVEGNQITLSHAEQVPNNQRITRFTNVRLGVDGTNLHKGDLLLLGSNGKDFSASFGVDAFALRLKGKKLPDLLEGITVTVEQDDDGVAAPLGYRTAYADGGDCQFPVHYNPSIYGDANPAFFPSAQKWSNTTAYSVNQLVTFHLDLFDESWASTYQCIAPNTNIIPTTTAYWRKVFYGLVNSWDCEQQAYRRNTAPYNFYPLVPWFYTKWVLKQAMQSLGFRAEGTFLTDHATDELLVPNAATLDRGNQPDPDVFFNVGSTPVQDAILMRATDESSGSFSDTLNLWDNNKFTPNQAGTWAFKFQFTYYARGTAGTRFEPASASIRMQTSWSSPIRAEWSIPLPPESTVQIGGQDYTQGTVFTGELPVSLTAADLTQHFYFSFNINGTTWQYFPGASGPPTPGISQLGYYSAVNIRGWLATPLQPAALPDPVVRAARHVPDVDAAQWLNALAEAFNLSITPDLRNNTVSFDYRTVHGTPAPDHTHRLNGPVAFDHSAKATGRRYTWDVKDKVTEQVPNGTNIAQVVERDALLTAPLVRGLYTLVLNTRMLYKSVIDNATLIWQHIGYYLPDAVVGDADNAEEIKPGMVPLLMREATSEGFQLLVPIFDQPGKSDFYFLDNDLGQMGMCLFSRQSPSLMQSLPQFNYPAALSWGIAFQPGNTTAVNCSFVADQVYNAQALPPTLFNLAHRRWAETIVTAEPVVMDLRVDHPFLLGKEWQRPLLIDHQRYLVNTLPVTYANNKATPMAPGTRALRLRDGIISNEAAYGLPIPPPGPPDSFVCSGPGYASVTVDAGAGGAAYVYAITSTGHYAVRDAATGTVTVDGFGLSDGGSYCVWSCDEDGNISGDITELYLSLVSVYDASGLPALEVLQLDSCTMSTLPALDIHPALINFTLTNCLYITALPALSSNTDLTVFAVDNSPLLTALPSLASNTAIAWFEVNNCPLLTAFPSLSTHAALRNFRSTSCPIPTSLPAFHTSALVDIYVKNASALTSVGALPKIIRLWVEGTAITSSVPVDALVNTLTTDPAATKYANFNGLLSLRTSASDTNYAACIAAGWIIV